MPRSNAAVLLVVLTLLASCKKDDDSPSNNPGGGGGNTNPGDGSVTSWSPVRPYPDEQITFKGSGFGTDLADVHVYLWGQANHAFSVVSVSDTQLVLAPPADLNSLLNVPQFAAIQFITPGGTDTVPYFYWKAMVNLVGDGLDDPEGHLYNADVRAGDSIIVHARGLGAGTTVRLDGQIIGTLTEVDSDYYCYAYGRLLPDAFTTTEMDESVVASRLLTVTNADGHSDTATVQVGISPHMVLNGISYSGPSTFVAGSATSFNGTIVGRYLKSCVLLRLTGPGGTFDTYPVGGGFPNELPFGQPVVGLDPGQWTFRVFDCGGGLAGEVSFLVQ